MIASDLIGEVVASYLRGELATERADAQDGTGRYILDCLTLEQIAAIAQAILKDTSLSEKIDLKLPVKLASEYDLPEAILTERPATYFRNASCEKPVRVVANMGDDEQQSLKEFISIGAAELRDQADLWVHVARQGLHLLPEHAKWWEKALVGLQQLRLCSLDRFAAYVLKTREIILNESQPVIVALGAALPALQFPKDSFYFNGIKEKFRGRASEWKNLYGAAAKKRACYLLKQTASQILLDEDELTTSFEKVKDTIPEMHHPPALAFIHAAYGWNDQAARLAECEWEEISPLFQGMKHKKYGSVRIEC